MLLRPEKKGFNCRPVRINLHDLTTKEWIVIESEIILILAEMVVVAMNIYKRILEKG